MKVAIVLQTIRIYNWRKPKNTKSDTIAALFTKELLHVFLV